MRSSGVAQRSPDDRDAPEIGDELAVCRALSGLAHALFDRVRVGRNVEGEFHKIDQRLDNLLPARAFADYKIEIHRNGLPEGVEIIEWV